MDTYEEFVLVHHALFQNDCLTRFYRVTGTEPSRFDNELMDITKSLSLPSKECYSTFSNLPFNVNMYKTMERLKADDMHIIAERLRGTLPRSQYDNKVGGHAHATQQG